MNRRFFLPLAASFFFLTLTVLPIAHAQDAPEYKARADSEKTWPKQAVRGAHGMVATDEELASRAGVEILQRGETALAAPAAPAFALPVVGPAAGNSAGGGSCWSGWQMAATVFSITAKLLRAKQRAICMSSLTEHWTKSHR